MAAPFWADAVGAKRLLAVAHLLLRFQPAAFRRRACGENFKQRDEPRFGRHRLGVNHGEDSERVRLMIVMSALPSERKRDRFDVSRPRRLDIEIINLTPARASAFRGLESVGHFTEVESGKVNDRPQLAAAKARGTKLGSSHPSRDVPRQVRLMVAGYRREKTNFLNRVRPIVEEIRSTGVSTLQGIAECLTRRGIPTRTGKSVWFPSTVKTVLG